MTECCARCRFARAAMGADNKISFQTKTCQRNPKTLLLVPMPAGPALRALWPIMGAHEWCGEFQESPGTIEAPLPGENTSVPVPAEPEKTN